MDLVIILSKKVNKNKDRYHGPESVYGSIGW